MTNKKMKSLAFREGRKDLGLSYDMATKYSSWKLGRKSTIMLTAYDFVPKDAILAYSWEEYCHSCDCTYHRDVYLLANGRYIEIDDHLQSEIDIYAPGVIPTRY
jgi:hypothetical protein